MSYLNNDMHRWFAYLFEQRMDNNHIVYCYECGKPMYEDVYKDLSICYSHILPKKLYPEQKGNPDNICIVCGDCHTLYGLKPKKAVKQYALYLTLKGKFTS